ncbi:Prophage minor tail protein Z (GPZ) [Cohnella sp. OV330]|uniref:phage tail protein n=1 Tax=Cohnella sp. OV330 TaxID=1855288 RepID=UPI0008EFA29F|nr:phage tail protein [Cohnella sp. OV330]SFA91615.1 Prophage minor tail protein Z (GPZ) [Cohnella sp. OV330]
MMEFRGEIVNLKEAVRLTRSTAAEVPKAYYRAMNRATQRVRTESGREVSRIYHVRAGDVKNTVSIKRGSARSMVSEVRWKGGNIPLFKFRTNPNKPRDPMRPPPKILKAAVKRAGLKPVKGAFIARVGAGGHIGAFKRAGRRRLPIEELYGPAVPIMVGEEHVLNNLGDIAETEVKKRLDHEIKRILEKGGI